MKPMVAEKIRKIEEDRVKRKRDEDERHAAWHRRQRHQRQEESQRSLEKMWPALFGAFFGIPIGCIVVGASSGMLWIGIPAAIITAIIIGCLIVSLIRDASGAGL